MIYTVNATAQTPLSFRAGRNNTEAATTDYIPGGALLGGLVTAHRLMRNNPAELNAFLFDEATCVSDLYPCNLEDSETLAEKLQPLQDDSLPVYPLPLTAHSCKRFGGFLFDSPKTGDHHGMYDHLFPWTVFTLSGQTKFGPLLEHQHCAYAAPQTPECCEERSPLTGFYRRGVEPDQWARSQVKQMLRTFTGINRSTGTVEEAILFSRSVLAEKSRFWGTIRVDDKIAVGFESFITEASEAGLIRVGSNRSRGMGRIEVTLAPAGQDTAEQLAGRLELFNTRLRSFLEQYELKPDHKLYVPLMLTADATLPDHLLRYCTYIPPEYLAEEWEIGPATLIYSSARTRRVMGWNSLWQLPKPDELAISRGSVFLFGLPVELEINLLNNLLKLEQAGIGTRRREGMGQLMVANPFHWEVNNV